MDRKEIVAAAGAYWDANRDAIVADIAKLVEIPSTEDLAAAAPGAPYRSESSGIWTWFPRVPAGPSNPSR